MEKIKYCTIETSQFILLTLSDVPGLFHCSAIPQFSNTSNSHKMAYSHHFFPFSLFSVSININCFLVQAQTQFILLTLTSYNKKKKDVLPMNQQHRFIFWGVLLIVVLLSVSSITFPIFVAQTVKNQNVICIDAGHGGCR